jgi:hypothetical protein
MSRTLVLSLAALAGVAFFAGAALARASSRPSIHVKPTPVAPGGKVHVYGNAGACAPGSQIMAISRAFPGHAFGEGALSGTVRANHTYSINGHIRSGQQAGTYSVDARCGGGNLGVSTHVKVS